MDIDYLLTNLYCMCQFSGIYFECVLHKTQGGATVYCNMRPTTDSHIGVVSKSEVTLQWKLSVQEVFCVSGRIRFC